MNIAWGALAGLAIGLVYFLGLRLTVRILAQTTRPAPILLVSVALRMGVLLAGFYLMRPLGAPAMLAGLGAVMLVRIALVRREKSVLHEQKQGGELREHRSE